MKAFRPAMSFANRTGLLGSFSTVAPLRRHGGPPFAGGTPTFVGSAPATHSRSLVNIPINKEASYDRLATAKHLETYGGAGTPAHTLAKVYRGFDAVHKYVPGGSSLGNAKHLGDEIVQDSKKAYLSKDLTGLTKKQKYRYWRRVAAWDEKGLKHPGNDAATHNATTWLTARQRALVLDALHETVFAKPDPLADEHDDPYGLLH